MNEKKLLEIHEKMLEIAKDLTKATNEECRQNECTNCIYADEKYECIIEKYFDVVLEIKRITKKLPY